MRIETLFRKNLILKQRSGEIIEGFFTFTNKDVFSELKKWYHEGSIIDIYQLNDILQHCARIDYNLTWYNI